MTLDAVAKDAGVGIGTLYRHFPTRAALLEAAYRDELTRLCGQTAGLLRDAPPHEAARTWMEQFVECVTARPGTAEALRALLASGERPYVSSLERLDAAVTALLRAGAATGTLRRDVSPADVLTSLCGVCLAAGEPEQREQARRMLGLLMDGLRHGAARSAAGGAGTGADTS